VVAAFFFARKPDPALNPIPANGNIPPNLPENPPWLNTKNNKMLQLSGRAEYKEDH
jgi:hypothetical protein